MRDLPIMPEQASNFASGIDALFFTLSALTVVFTLIVVMMIVIFTMRYRRGNKVNRNNPVYHNTILEMAWSIGPLFLALGVFVWAAKLYASMYGSAPKDSLEIYVIGKQWMWHLQHPNGIRENNELHVPVGQPVKLTMISQDVIHSFYVPAFRIKRDVIPGQYTSVWFTPTKAGRYHLFCAEYCGNQHSEMTGYVTVMEPSEFNKWVASGGQRIDDNQPMPLTMEGKGKALYEQQGCGNCHDSDGTGRGPLVAGLYGSMVKTQDGRTVLADDGYLRKSILDPTEEIVSGYNQIMPSYRNQLSEEQVLQLISYMKSLGRLNPATAATKPKVSAQPAKPVAGVQLGKPEGNGNERNSR